MGWLSTWIQAWRRRGWCVLRCTRWIRCRGRGSRGCGEGALQAAFSGAAQADRNYRLAGGVCLLGSGGSGAAAGEFQYSA